jgi:hypothetical protein
MDQAPPVDDQLEIKFLRQNVQINIGCNFHYAPRKARRSPGTVGAPPGSTNFVKPLEKKKNLFLPLALDEWETLTDKQKKGLIGMMKDEGILDEIVATLKAELQPPPSVSTGERKTTGKKILELLGNSMTKVTGWLKRLFRRK